MFLGMRSDVADEAEGFASVRTRLGPADLATVDALITAGIASSRAEVMRWAIGRIRENPAYAQLQERVRQIGELKAQF
jgi:Arc/MetJ-type ribon-helix-helix transcriptional regulator